MNDAKYKFSGEFGIGNADVKKEGLLDHSSYDNNEGKSALHLSKVLFWNILGSFFCQYNTFIRVFDLSITGHSTSKIDIDHEDVIDLKIEPVEVSDDILWVCARLLVNVFGI